MMTLRKWAFLLACMTPLALAPSRAGAAITFSMTPQAGVDLNHLAIGQTFTLAITATLGDPRDDLTVFGTGEDFGGSKQVNTFRVNSITAGDLVTDVTTLATSSTSTGFSLRFAPAAPIASSGTIAYVSLTAVTPNQGAFYRYYGEFAGSSNNGLSATGFAASFNVVPEPSSLALAGTAAVLGLVVARGRRGQPQVDLRSASGGA